MGNLVFGPLAGQPIATFGRDVRSGTHDEFARHALCGGTFSDQVHEEPAPTGSVAARLEASHGQER